MKKFLILLSTLTSFATFAQEPCGHHEMILHDAVNDTSFVRRASAFSNVSRSTFEQKTIPVIVHIFHEGEDYGEGSHLTQEIVIEAIDHLNQVFSGLSSSDNDTYIDFCLATQSTSGFPIEGVLYHDLNFYPSYTGSLGDITDNNMYINMQNTYQYDIGNYMEIFVAPWTSGYLGFTSIPPSTLGIWVRTNLFGFGSHIVSESNLNTTLCHEVGHWCGLLHTFANGLFNNYDTCAEASQESDCSTYGDRVCDTSPTKPTWGCLPSCQGDDVSNMMSYFTGTCRTGFTYGQIERMHEKILQYRYNQLGNDLACIDIQGCTDPSACNYLETAVFEDGSCEYADFGFDCNGNAMNSLEDYVNNIQELYASNTIKSYECYDTFGNLVKFNEGLSSGIYMLVAEYHNGTREVIKVYIDGSN